MVMMKKLLRPSLLSALLLVASAGCAGTHGVASDYDFADVATYAWRQPPKFAKGTKDGEEEELRDFERRVQRVMERRGIELVPKDRAQILLAGEVRVDQRTQTMDPNYSVYSAEQYEMAILTLEAFDRTKRQLVWTDSEELRLRTTGRRFGRRLVEEFTETGDERRWRIYDMVDALLARWPE